LEDVLRNRIPAGAMGTSLGVGFAAIILSLACTFTPVHIEDLLLGAVNMLLLGAWKVWFLVPKSGADQFMDLLKTKYGPSAAKQVRCFVL